MNAPQEFDYVSGMQPPVVPLEPDWADESTYDARLLRDQQEKNRRYQFRKALFLTTLPAVLAVVCWFAVNAAIDRVNAVRAQVGKPPLTILGRKL